MATIAQVEKQSVQSLPDAERNGGFSESFVTTTRGFILPPWGTRQRERVLRLYSRHEYNWMGQSAFAGLIKKVSATPWEIRGKRNVDKYAAIMREADFGRGWSSFLSKFLHDYLRQDSGGYAEIIAPGNPKRAPTGMVSGLAPLDSLASWPTGDPEFPVLYCNTDGKYTLLHHTRVMRLVDMPDSDQRNPGYGLSALSRAIAIVSREINMGRFVDARLDDRPSPGIIIGSNINEAHWNKAFAAYRMQQSNDERPDWGRNAAIFSTNPDFPADVKQVTFAQAPESWSYIDYTELDANAWALALGVDVQELWQLTGGSLGSGQQSAILHAKSQGKAFGDILTQLERLINQLLPDSLEFEFKRRDPYEAQERADAANKWASFVKSVEGTLSVDEQRRLLANMVEAYADTVTDEGGAVTRLDDLDTEATAPLPDAPDMQGDVTPTTTAPAQENTVDEAKAYKALQATRLDFENDWADLLDAARGEDMNRRRFGLIARALIGKYGRRAYEDGLVDGGIEDGELDNSDRQDVMALTAEQSAYVTSIGDTLFKGDGISNAQAELKPELWWNKSLYPFYEAGLYSADKNGMYTWALGNTEVHCTTCKRLEGQVHRLKNWVDKGWVPKAERLECGGWRCDCSLKQTKGRTTGSY